MPVEVRIARLRARRALRISRLIAFIQSIAIFLLLVAMSEEYEHNQFFQAWTGARIGGLAFLLNGTLAAFYAGTVIAYYLSAPAEREAEPLIGKKEEIPVEAEAIT